MSIKVILPQNVLVLRQETPALDASGASLDVIAHGLT